MEYRRFRFELFANAVRCARNGVWILLWGIGVMSHPMAVAQVTPPPCGHEHNKPAILYTGTTYGYLRANDPVDKSAASAFDRSYSNVFSVCPEAILVGMGDNLAPEYGSRIRITDPESFIERINPQRPHDANTYLQLPPHLGDWIRDSPAVEFFLGERNCKGVGGQVKCDPKNPKEPYTPQYDAMVPGQLDFYFGADFLARAGSIEHGLPLLGANLTIQTTKQLPPVQPTCGQAQLLLPTQVSLPIQAGGSGGGGGGKGGKGGKGGGGSGQGSSGQAASSSGQSGTGQSGTGQSGQTCLQPETPGQAGPKGVTLVGPPTNAIYPWTSAFEFSVDSSKPGESADGPASDSPKPSDTSDKRASGDHEATTTQAVTAAYLCSWSASRIDQKTMLDVSNDSDCKPLMTPKPVRPNQLKSVTTFIAEVPTNLIPITADGVVQPKVGDLLTPDNDLQLCAVTTGGKKCTTTPFRVKVPFFGRAWIAVSHNGVSYAVFGALDPALQGLISPENSSWGSDNQYTAQINISDPGPVLQQQLTTFRRLRGGDTHWTYVLLAQMPKATAQALSASLQWHQEQLPLEINDERLYHFDVILSQASHNEATADTILLVDQWNGAQPIRSTPVITPHPMVTLTKMRNPLQLLVVDTFTDGQVQYTNYTSRSARMRYLDANQNDNHRNEYETEDAYKDRPFSRACSKSNYREIDAFLDKYSTDYLRQQSAIKAYLIDPKTNKPRKICSTTRLFPCVALEQMREQLSADIAFLQNNDFYDECNYEGPEGESAGWAPIEMVNRVLWNSGYLTRVSVSGATLRAILQNSTKIQQSEESSTNEPLARKQDLVTLGVSQANGLYFVDGAAVDDNKIYSVATSDQLAFEASAYPQFSQVDLVAPTVFTGWKRQTYAIAQLASVPFLPPTQACALDREEIVAFGPNVGDPIKTPKGVKSPPLARDSATELAVQNRNFLTMTLQQASLGYMNSKPSQSDNNINSNLAGVTNPNVAAPRSDNLSYSDSFRLLYEWTQYVNLGFDQLLNFARGRQGSLTATTQVTPTGQPVPEESISLSANTFIASPFVEFQPHRYQGGHWKAVARPVTFSTQLSRTLQFLPTMTKNEVYELNLRRQENWQPSVGGRYEKDSLNFFEAGYLNQTARNVLSALTIDGVTTPLTAGATAAEVAAKVTPLPGSVATPVYGTFHQQGGYWLGLYTRLLTPKGKNVAITYQGQTYGNFFAYGPVDRTSTALTRYAAELSNSLQVQLWGNISIGPTYSIFWFQDQSHSAGDNLTRGIWNVQLNYLFDWHQGLEWKYALAGKTSQ